MVGKWQILRLLGRYRDAQGSKFRLGEFHDRLISYGSLPLSVIEWLMFDDDSSLKTERGWDDVTGVGSITPAYFSRVSGGSRR